jgi:hypothetical protein
MQNTIIQIGNFSYYANKVAGQGATGLVYKGKKNIIKVLETPIKLQSQSRQLSYKILILQ